MVPIKIVLPPIPVFKDVGAAFIGMPSKDTGDDDLYASLM